MSEAMKQTKEGKGTIRYMPSETVNASCDVCWDGPKGRWGQGWVKEFWDGSEFKMRADTRAKIALTLHIKNYHGLEPVIVEKVGWER